MNISNKYRPKTEAEWVGDREVLKELESCISKTIPVILHGPPGCGKNSAVYLIAEKLGYAVVEINSSDERKEAELLKLEICLRAKTFKKTLFLLDEVDGVGNQDLLTKVVVDAAHPVVLIANDLYSLSLELKKRCKTIEVVIKPMQIGLVVNRIKEIAAKEGRKVTYQGITTDVRESINKVFLNSDGYEKDTNYFEKVEALFKRGKIAEIPPIWLLDNLTNFYFGKDLYDAIKLIAVYAVERDSKILSCLPRAKSGKCEYPYFLRKRRKMDGPYRGV